MYCFVININNIKCGNGTILLSIGIGCMCINTCVEHLILFFYFINCNVLLIGFLQEEHSLCKKYICGFILYNYNQFEKLT